MKKWSVVALLVLLVLVGAMALRNATVERIDGTPVLMANGGAPMPPIKPALNGGAPMPPIKPGLNGGAPMPPIKPNK